MSKSKMERQIVVSGNVQWEEKKQEEGDLESKQVSDELDKSCLTEEHDDYLSDQNSKKRTREVKKKTSDSEPEKRKKRKSSKDTSSFDDWLFVATFNPHKKATNHKKVIKFDDEDMNKKMDRSSCGGCFFPKAQFLSHVGIFSLPYTVLF
ncbi:unnamed protein product [Eruca vesicaria subsp. sativa]|uniref:Uncharacterized protein n=1 Tax=Eruca vesicaria subsp. sativa TaxID=29727 RepID=A0ABC8JKW2_ERUVS|nr:unnamed protein product [Eruca vesicaria subsp. sativa]